MWVIPGGTSLHGPVLRNHTTSMKTNPLFRRLSAAFFPLLISAVAAAFWALPVSAPGQMFLSGGGVNEYTTSGTPLVTPLISSSNAFGTIAVSGSNLFVVSAGDGFAGSSSIGEYTTSGYQMNSALVTGLDNPAGIAVSDDGSTLFVADIGDGTVSSYDTATGEPIQAPLISGLPGPISVAVSGSNLFVLNSNYLDSSGTTGSIGMYTTDGGILNASLVTGLDGPQFFALSGSDLFVASTGIPSAGNYSFRGTVGEYSVSGTSVTAINPTLIHGLTTPQVIAVSGTDIFVSNNNSLDEYNTSGIPWSLSNGPALLNIAPAGLVVVGRGSRLPEFRSRYPVTQIRISPECPRERPPGGYRRRSHFHRPLCASSIAGAGSRIDLDWKFSADIQRHGKRQL